MTDDLVTRLRERIDWVTDQRDAALADLHEVRLQRARWYEKAVRRSNGRQVCAQRLARMAAELERLERELAGERAMRRLHAERNTTEPGSSPVVGALPGSEGTHHA